MADRDLPLLSQLPTGCQTKFPSFKGSASLIAAPLGQSRLQARAGVRTHDWTWPAPCAGGWEQVCVSLHALGMGEAWGGVEFSIFVCYPNTRARWRSMPVLPNLCVRVHAYTCTLVHAEDHPSSQARMWGERRSALPPPVFGPSLPCSRLEICSG